MKFMVTGTPSSTPIPPEQGVFLYTAAIAWMEERLNNGKVDCHYTFPDRGGFAIVNVNTAEELDDEILSYPLYPFFDWDVAVLAEWKHSYRSIMELFKKLGAK